jgi:signal transduction histidine kinase
MKHPRSLKFAFTWWFAGTLVVLYGVVATAAALDAAADARRDVAQALKGEAETVATYVAATGRLDAPELAAPEHDPVTLWLRVLRGRRVVAATPGFPPIPIEAPSPAGQQQTTAARLAGGGGFLVVQHPVGGLGQGLTVEAAGSTAPLLATRRRVNGGLLLVGLVVIPIAAFGGRLLAAWALAPVDSLVAAIRTVDPERMGQRLTVPAGSAAEVAALAGAFDDLLDRLQASIESTRRFTADASHELRNPLSVLRTGLEVALRRPRPAEEYRDLLRRSLEEIQRVQTVVEGLLALARDAPGQLEPLEPQPVDLSDLVAQTAAAFAAVAGEAQVTIEQSVPTGLTVPGDPALLRLLVFNLLDNAIRHSPEGGAVALRAEEREDGVRLLVEDGGPGVAAADRERLFGRFYRAGRSPDGGVGGLGLSVVRWVAERHGGLVRLLDRERGAAFEVLLPAEATPDAAPG